MVGIWEFYVDYFGVGVGAQNSYISYYGVMIGVLNWHVDICAVVVGVFECSWAGTGWPVATRPVGRHARKGLLFVWDCYLGY